MLLKNKNNLKIALRCIWKKSYKLYIEKVLKISNGRTKTNGGLVKQSKLCYQKMLIKKR